MMFSHSLEKIQIFLRRYGSQLFGITWRVTIILLPWQTRWFMEGLSLGGYPWEGGRASVYLSWLPLITTILLFGFDHIRTQNDSKKKTCAPCFVIALILVALLSSIYLQATIQWFVEACLLAAFAYATVKSVDRSTVCRWLVYATLPHALLGIEQFLVQMAIGSKWLGISSQNPLTLGVSVVQTIGQRWLRAYGGFPHPNIFGGWLVLGIAAIIQERKTRKWIKYFFLSILTVALVLTFSRSAWLALVILLVAYLFAEARRHKLELKKYNRHFLMVLGTIAVVFSATVVWQWPLIATRSAPTTRLEAISVNERKEGFQNGWELFKHHPLFGVGPRTTAYALVKEKIVPLQTIPIIPHNIFLLILDELGIIGCCLLGGLALLLIRPTISSTRRDLQWRIILPFATISILDHYPWSTWSGLVWTMLIFCVIFAEKKQDEPGTLFTNDMP